MKFKTRKCLFTIMLPVCFAVAVQAQVTIGSGEEPHKDALLDIKQKKDGSSQKGMLLPRVSLKATDDTSPMSETDLSLLKGMTVYNLATTGTGRTAVTSGVYYHDGWEWVKMGQQAKSGEWFYMPAVELDASSTGPKTAVDLHDLYKKQFTKASNPTFVKNPAAPDDIPSLQKNELHYYITHYDPDIFDTMTLDNDGVLSYSVKNEAIMPTFVTIVFVAK